MVTVSSHANIAAAKPTHSSGKVLSDLATVAIDNCVEPEDSQVDIGRPEKVAAGFHHGRRFIAMSLVAETGPRLLAKGNDAGHVRVAQCSGNRERPQPKGLRGVRQGDYFRLREVGGRTRANTNSCRRFCR